MLNYIGVPNQISSDPKQIENAEKLILPGVGAFANAMNELEGRGFIAPLNQAVQERKTPVMGICLGMQLLCDGSEEGDAEGLGWVNGRAEKFDFGENSHKLRIPHMGWKETSTPQSGALFEQSGETQRFYFVHSYHVVCDDENDVAAWASYGYPFTAAIEKGHIYGAQFHPEKSHRFGMQLLEKFSKVAGPC